MSRTPVAVIAGLIFIAAWLAGATVLADYVRNQNTIVQFAYYATAGDRLVFGGWLFEVLEMDGRRVAKVRASREALAAG
jgi:hypothetical protein